MKNFSTIFLLLFFWIASSAQEPVCDATVIKNIKGKWVAGEDNIVLPDKTFPRNQYNQLNTRIDKIAGLFQQAYPQPMGIEAKWYRSIRESSLVKNGPVPYQFNSLYKGWYCNQNLHKLMLGSETGTWAFVWVNTLGWFMTDQFDKTALPIEGNNTYMLPHKIGEWKNLPVYAHSDKKREKVVLIARDNQLPYKPVTRLQFLSAMKTRLVSQRKEQIDAQRAQPVRSDADEEAARQKGLENIVKTNPLERVDQRKAEYLKNYQTAKQRKEESIQRTEQYFMDRLKPVEDGLNGDKNELQLPAIVTDNFVNFFKTFTTEEKGGHMLVSINNDYFNLQLPRYVPQVIVLYWSWDVNSTSLDFNKAVEENFPADKLKAMIDK